MKVKQFPHRWDGSTSVASEDFAIKAAEVLRGYGYNVLGGESLVFSRDDSPKARLQLGGTVHELAYDTYAPLAGNSEEAVLGVQWELLDTYVDSVVYTRETRGHARLARGAGSVVQLAFADALSRVLSDTNFVAHVALHEDESRFAVPVNTFTISACPVGRPLGLPEAIEESFRSVVVVRPGTTLGSGVIISSDGHLLTAAHVVSGLERVRVRLRSGIVTEADVLAIDPRQDIALLDLPGNNHDCVRSASTRVPLGADLFAVGSPRSEELSYSVTRGVVSGYRDLDGREYIQTDASLNPGNSGGPLLTRNGELAGIVSWKVVSPGSEGLAFGVPVDVAFEVLGITFGN